MTKYLLVAMSAIVLTGCFDEETKSVDYYVNNENEMKIKVDECRQNPGEKRFLPNCENAMKAQTKLLMDSRKTETPKLELKWE